MNGDPLAVVFQLHVADVPEIATTPDVPQEVIADPPALKVTVPVWPAPTVAVIATTEPSSRGEDGESAIERVETCFVIVNVADLLAEYQFASPALVTVIEHVPEAFCAVTVSPRVPLNTQSGEEEVNVNPPVPDPPLAVRAVGTL